MAAAVESIFVTDARVSGCDGFFSNTIFPESSSAIWIETPRFNAGGRAAADSSAAVSGSSLGFGAAERMVAGRGAAGRGEAALAHSGPAGALASAAKRTSILSGFNRVRPTPKL